MFIKGDIVYEDFVHWKIFCVLCNICFVNKLLITSRNFMREKNIYIIEL